MKSRKKTTRILFLGLMLTAFTAGTAQTTTPSQTDQKKATESCCSMESCCCCSGDSCDMKMKHDDANMKHDMKDHKGDCCKMQKDKNKKAA